MANNALSIFFQDIEYPQERKHIYIFYDIYHSGFSECNIMIEMSEKWAPGLMYDINRQKHDFYKCDVHFTVQMFLDQAK